jgi:hypothetical protein
VVRWTCIGLPVLYLVIFAAVGSPVSLVTVGAVAQALMLPLLALAALYSLYVETMPSLRPGRAWTALLWLSAVLMAATGSYQLAGRLRDIVSP